MAHLYQSTRKSQTTKTAKEAILAGIADDGGLFVCDEALKSPFNLKEIVSQNYIEQARSILSCFFDDFSQEEIAECLAAAYTNSFDTEKITPLTPCGSDWLLELWHGPTCAFKDVALQLLPHLMTKAQSALSHPSKMLVITATSGDTGKAALEGFADVNNMGVVVFYPHNKVSETQRLQMVTQQGKNVAVVGVYGNFDDTQTEVKRLFTDKTLHAELHKSQIELTSANSINIGRLIPQITYYFSAYSQLLKKAAIQLGDEVEFCVPTGNFGDILAAYYAKLLGLPISRLIVASNANNVLTEFIQTGHYNRLRPFKTTISPSMDILVSSNLERLLYHLSDGDSDYVSFLMSELKTKGEYTISAELLARIQDIFSAGYVDDTKTRACIKRTWEENHILIDPHTAVAKNILDSTHSNAAARVCLSTANPYKFSGDVLAAFGHDGSYKDCFECMDELYKKTQVDIPAPLAALNTLPEIHLSCSSQDAMKEFVITSAQRIFE